MEAILDYLRPRSPNGAHNVLLEIEAAAERLIAQPFSGYETDIRDVLFIGRYPYKLFYRVRDQHVEILHVRHTSPKPGTD